MSSPGAEFAVLFLMPRIEPGPREVFNIFLLSG